MWCGGWTQQKYTVRNLLLTLKIGSCFSSDSEQTQHLFLDCIYLLFEDKRRVNSLSSACVQEELITAQSESGSIAVKHCAVKEKKQIKQTKNNKKWLRCFVCCSSVCCFHHTLRLRDDSLAFLSPPWWVKTTSGANGQGDKRQSYSNTNTQTHVQPLRSN